MFRHKYLCFYDSKQDITYFSLYKNELECIQHFRNQYKSILKDYNKHTIMYSELLLYDAFINLLNDYDMQEDAVNNNVLFIKDEIIFNNETLEFNKQNNKLPCIITDAEFNIFSEDTKFVLDTVFNKMYSEDDFDKLFVKDLR